MQRFVEKSQNTKIIKKTSHWFRATKQHVGFYFTTMLILVFSIVIFSLVRDQSVRDHPEAAVDQIFYVSDTQSCASDINTGLDSDCSGWNLTS